MLRSRNIKIGFIIFVLLSALVRFYNLGVTARFTEDESKDLVGMHQIFVDKKLTLVGPTNEQGTKVFSSLTFYMLLPAAVLLRFDPVGPVYGTAFWGVLTALLFVYLTKLLNPKLVPYVALLTLVWFPLLETSRWAWNPNLIPFWVSLGLVCFQIPKKHFRFLMGFFFGLAVHNHYYAIFAVGIFLALLSVHYLLKKRFAEILLMGLGFCFSLLPFALFDLRHPPGIFLPNLLSQSKSVGGGIILSQVFSKTLLSMQSLLTYYTQSFYLAIPLIILVLILFFYDVLKRNFSLIFIVPWVFQSFAIALIPEFFPHYLIPGLAFFVSWVIFKRKGIGKKLTYSIISILILGGIFSVQRQLTTPTSAPPIAVAGKIAEIIKNKILKTKAKNVNIAVLASPDLNTYGKKYRDLLLVPENIHILSVEEYSITDNLFVISISSPEVVRTDPAVEMDNFRKGVVAETWKLDDSGWFVYHFEKGRI